MAAATANSEAKWLSVTLTVILAAVSVSTSISLYLLKRKSRALESQVCELESSLKSSSEKCISERQGRIRAQKALREALTQGKSHNLEAIAYPMTPIGIVQSCFSTRNGTPRQPLLVPLARACLIFNPSRVPPASLEGLGEYSHCWIIYVFHLNTDLEKLWKDPSRSKFKAKVRVPRLEGRRIGVFATRSPHRPCPIGITVAKVEAVQGNIVLLSGVDLVDETPILDVKPYLPYSDSIEGATIPKWLMVDSALTVASIGFSPNFTSMLADSWADAGKHSLYGSADEFQSLVRQVLSWDIRSVSQRNRPHDILSEKENDASDREEHKDEATSGYESEEGGSLHRNQPVIYHVILEGLDVSYRMDPDGNVCVEKVVQSSVIHNKKRCNYQAWREIVA